MVTAAQTCIDGFPTGKFYDANGNKKPLVASGYYSKQVPGVNFGKLQPLTTWDLWSYACPASGVHTDAARASFCNNLLDASGNIVTNPPACCGGTGPEIFNYNVVDAALVNVQDQAAQIASQFDVSEKVKKIIGAGVLVFILIIAIYLLI